MRWVWAPGVLLAAALAAPVLSDGGFDSPSRFAFVALSGAALAAAFAVAPAAAARAARHPVVLALAGLAALAGLSAIWTADAVDARAWWLVVAAYAAAIVAAAAAASIQGGGTALLVVVCCLAAVTAIMGLAAMGLRSEPFALKLDGAWRPAGPFEYPPALALLQVMAMPVLLWGMASGRGRTAALAAAAAAAASTVVVLAGSRFELAVLVALLAVAIARPALIGGTRGVALAAGALCLLAGGLGGAGGSDAILLDRAPGRLLPVVAAIAIGAAVWVPVRRRIETMAASLAPPAGTRIAVPALVVVSAVALALAAFGSGSSRVRVDAVSSGPAHGREDLWRAAVDTALDAPVIGHGSESFGHASARHQDSSLIIYAHNLPLETAAELGLLGLLVVIGLYAAAAVAVIRSRGGPVAFLASAGAAAFLAANLVDWSWHLAGLGAVWAVLLGVLIASPAGRSAAHP